MQKLWHSTAEDEFCDFIWKRDDLKWRYWMCKKENTLGLRISAFVNGKAKRNQLCTVPVFEETEK